MREPTGEHDVPVEPVLTWRDLDKGHAHLEGDPGLFGKDGHRPAGGNRAPHALVESANGGVLPEEMVLEVVPIAGVGLVAVREGTPATRAGPQWGTSGCAHTGEWWSLRPSNGMRVSCGLGRLRSRESRSLSSGRTPTTRRHRDRAACRSPSGDQRDRRRGMHSFGVLHDQNEASCRTAQSLRAEVVMRRRLVGYPELRALDCELCHYRATILDLEQFPCAERHLVERDGSSTAAHREHRSEADNAIVRSWSHACPLVLNRWYVPGAFNHAFPRAPVPSDLGIAPTVARQSRGVPEALPAELTDSRGWSARLPVRRPAAPIAP